MREAVDYDDAPGAEQGWLTGCATNGIPGITGVDTRALVRHIRSAGAMRGGIFPRDVPEGEARERDRRRAEHGRPRPRARGDDRRAAASTQATATARGSSRSTPASSARSSATSPRAARRSSSTRARRPPRSCSRATPTASSSSPAPATRRRWTTSSTRSARCSTRKPVFGICLGHQLLSRAVGLETFKLPVRPPRRQPPGQGPARRAGSRSPRRTTASRSRASPASASQSDLGEARAHPREPLRRHDRGHPAARRPRRLRPVPPRGGPGAERLARPVRRVHRSEFAHAA